MNIFWDVKILWRFLGGHHKNGLFFLDHFNSFSMSFLKVSVQNGNILGGGVLKFQIFFGVCLIFFMFVFCV